MRRLFVLLLVLSSCYPRNPEVWVKNEVCERTGFITYQQCCDQYLDNLSSSKITVDDAVQIALLKNPLLRAEFENIGIARAKVLEAILPRNPMMEWTIRHQTNPTEKYLDIEWSLVGFLFDIFLVPLKRNIAMAELRETQLSTANRVLELILEVKIGYYQLQDALDKLKLQKFIVDASEIIVGVAEQQFSAGNINDLTLEAYKNRYRHEILELLAAERRVDIQKESLTRLLGLECSEYWSISEYAIPISFDISCRDLEKIALNNRLDLQAARWKIAKVARTKYIFDWWTYFDPQVGPAQEREPPGDLKTGAAVNFSLPLFNWGQGEQLKLSAETRRQLNLYNAKVVDILSQVRESYMALLNAKEGAIFYRDEVIPLEEEILASILKQYNIMNKSIYDLLEQKQKIISAEIEYRSAIRDYMIQRARLEYALGGSKLEAS